jgi:hypothetical protein
MSFPTRKVIPNYDGGYAPSWAGDPTGASNQEMTVHQGYMRIQAYQVTLTAVFGTAGPMSPRVRIGGASLQIGRSKIPGNTANHGNIGGLRDDRVQQIITEIATSGVTPAKERLLEARGITPGSRQTLDRSPAKADEVVRKLWGPDRRSVMSGTVAEELTNFTTALPREQNTLDSRLERVMRPAGASPLKRVMQGKETPRKATQIFHERVTTYLETASEETAIRQTRTERLYEVIDEVVEFEAALLASNKRIPASSADHYLRLIEEFRLLKKELQMTREGCPKPSLRMNFQILTTRMRQHRVLNNPRLSAVQKVDRLLRRPLAPVQVSGVKRERTVVGDKLELVAEYLGDTLQGTQLPPRDFFGVMVDKRRRSLSPNELLAARDELLAPATHR